MLAAPMPMDRIPAQPRAAAKTTRRPPLCAGLALLAALAAAVPIAASASSVRVNEVADKGTPTACDGADWIELHLPADAPSAVDLGAGAGYVLHDDGGADDADALAFADAGVSFAPLAPGDYLLLCRGDGPGQFKFGIGGDDTVTLLDAAGNVASTTGELPDKGEAGIAYAYDEDAGAYAYTSESTPGEANVIVAPAFDDETDAETAEQTKARLGAQNDEGTAFFNMDGDGKEVEGGFPAIVDLHVEMDPDVRQDMHDRARSHATWRPWLSAKVTSGEEGDVLLDLPSPGRMRPKGQYTLLMGTCMDTSVPYAIDFGEGADGSDPSQTLFGVERAYLRRFEADTSRSREWAAHRMLARFGLPHLRTRAVRLHINGVSQGFYELIEAPDQEYVYYRSFPDYDPTSYGLYKIKLGTGGCGMYDEYYGPGTMAQAEARIDETDTPPYAFERGEHRPIIPIKKDYEQCVPVVYEPIIQKIMDAPLAYLRADTDCGEFLVDASMFDRKLGNKDMDEVAREFINNHLGPFTCEPGCTNSNLAEDVDITNFLRNLAVYAGIQHTDSPIGGNMQNFYLANNGGLWSMVQWDHNDSLQQSSVCGECDTVKWSIMRPTCRGFEQHQIHGPLLSDPDLHAQYLQYLREFVDEVMTDDEFLAQLRARLEAIQDEFADESFALELAVSEDEEDTWLPDPEEGTFLQYTPIIGMIYARAASVRDQLDAIDDGSFPRDLDDIDVEETCVDWTLDEPRKPSCPDNCLYEGCHREELTIPSICDPTTNTCYHGTLDSKCEGVPDMEGYDGIEPFKGSDQPAMCFNYPGIGPVKAAECPPKEIDPECVECEEARPCFFEGCYARDSATGAWEGVWSQCSEGALCEFCFPDSPCLSAPAADDAVCALCEEARPCFFEGCTARDGDTGLWSGFVMEGCNEAVDCEFCFPDSPCLTVPNDPAEIDPACVDCEVARPCFFEACALRDGATGAWEGDASGCNEGAVVCEFCFPDSSCLTAPATPEDPDPDSAVETPPSADSQDPVTPPSGDKEDPADPKDPDANSSEGSDPTVETSPSADSQEPAMPSSGGEAVDAGDNSSGFWTAPFTFVAQLLAAVALAVSQAM